MSETRTKVTQRASRPYAGLPPALAGDRAFRRFCTPRLSSHRSHDHDILTARARFHLRSATWTVVVTVEGPVQAYVFEPDGGTKAPETVLIAHGWTSESSFMAVFAEQLRRAGFRVIAFDQPGHGKTGSRRASLFDCARALLDVADALGPMRFVVAHSMGGLAALLAGEGKAPVAHAHDFERYVLIATPNRFSKVTGDFADEVGLSAAAKRHYERHIARIAHRSLSSFTAANLLAATSRPALLLHARDDTEVSFADAEAIAAACPKAELLPFDGFGHRNVLHAPPVIRAAVSYLKDASAVYTAP